MKKELLIYSIWLSGYGMAFSLESDSTLFFSIFLMLGFIGIGIILENYEPKS
jgi:hypothetical protein